ncbi:MAG: hypothetical protein H6684_16915 [Deltaproteobacteria bacterium]|nr:hypothetical protein [Deltaproteobacteria bacterium]MCB9479200.1 hypothetical protein [Deltaproteobacteria bacterium]MCB9490417.1 hypothetical protein [Deltaproteobacteria bacterium]
MATGKDYRKSEPLKGAALFYMTLEQTGMTKAGGAKEIMEATFADLGVTEDDVMAYIAENRADLEAELASRTGK